MQQTTSTEFVMWKHYLSLEMNRPSREDIYAAQIAAEIRRGNVKHPRKVKTKDFILKFQIGPKKDKRSFVERLAASKRYWLGLVGFGKGQK